LWKITENEEKVDGKFLWENPKIKVENGLW
jgi:hypothetical protein